MVSFMSVCEGAAVPFIEFRDAGGIIVYSQLQAVIVWGLVATLVATALGIVQQIERRRALAIRSRPGTARARGVVRWRLPAVWSSDPPVVHPPRRGAGGISGRVPPRSAAGSTPLPLRMAYPDRARRR
jgi:hypothetical protein